MPSFPMVVHVNCVINLLQDLVGPAIGPATCLLTRVAGPTLDNQPPAFYGERSCHTMLSVCCCAFSDSHRQGPSLSPSSLVWLGCGSRNSPGSSLFPPMSPLVHPEVLLVSVHRATQRARILSSSGALLCRRRGRTVVASPSLCPCRPLSSVTSSSGSD